ncbi:MAG: hypothetical protein ATN33_00900 [Epulopiscium sp. Nele67-Bin001]|nr:MAG: hypothetical protein BEN18_01700 [Epulopiscium sp. Nuni2H_MBin001]OON91552.1 MAG: hypothetical protein ATN33_00900 [Epulopiscium sp. Nele67-Bin001]
MVLFWILISIVVFLVFHYFQDKIFLCFLGGCVVTAIVCLFYNSSVVQLGVFGCSTLLFVVYVKCINKSKLFRKLNYIELSDLVGKQAIVVNMISADGGQVKLNGDVWYAKSLSSATYNKGDVVSIIGIKGLFVFVE